MYTSLTGFARLPAPCVGWLPGAVLPALICLVVLGTASAKEYEFPEYGIAITIPDSGWRTMPLDSFPMERRDVKTVAAFVNESRKMLTVIGVQEIETAESVIAFGRIDSMEADLRAKGVVMRSHWDLTIDGHDALLSSGFLEKDGLHFDYLLTSITGSHGYGFDIIQGMGHNTDGIPVANSELQAIRESFRYTGEPTRKSKGMIHDEQEAPRRMIAYAVIGAVLLAGLALLVIALRHRVKRDREKFGPATPPNSDAGDA